MGSKTSIEWTDATWNPVRGCSRVSQGCVNCYAETIAARFSDEGAAFHLYADRSKSGSKWTGKVALVAEHLLDPLRWRKPRMIFVNSMSDLWHENLRADDQAEVYGVMAAAWWQTFQVLTKRPENRCDAFADPMFAKEVEARGAKHFIPSGLEKFTWPLPNVWEGVSVEDQKTADERIPLLLQTPAAIRFVSYEPALGPVDFTKIAVSDGTKRNSLTGMFYGQRAETPDGKVALIDIQTEPHLDWIIAGGESGPGARPAHPDWFRSVRDQCEAAGVAFFFKQRGEYTWGVPPLGYWERPKKSQHWGVVDIAGAYVENATAWNGDTGENSARKIYVYRVGRRAAGALLDGREHKEFPKGAAHAQ